MKSSFSHLILAFFIGSIVSSGYVMWYLAISNKSNEGVNLQEQIVVSKENANRIAAARAALAQISGDEAKVQSYFVSEKNIASFINVLEQDGLAQKAVLKVLSVSKGDSSSQSTLIFALSVKGTFDAVMRTVGAIEYAPYAVSVSSLSIAQDVKNSWYANITLTVGSTSSGAVTNTQ